MTDPKPAGAMELKPCPFCGGEEISDLRSGTHRIIKCISADCRVNPHVRDLPEYAAPRWNTRAPLPAEAGVGEIVHNINGPFASPVDVTVIDKAIERAQAFGKPMRELKAERKKLLSPPPIRESVWEEIARLKAKTISDFKNGRDSIVGKEAYWINGAESAFDAILALSPPAERVGTAEPVYYRWFYKGEDWASGWSYGPIPPHNKDVVVEPLYALSQPDTSVMPSVQIDVR